jgi:hypothetical protein
MAGQARMVSRSPARGCGPAGGTINRYSPVVQKVDVAVLIVDESIEAKIRDKHFPLTAEDVRQTVVYGRVISAGWDDSDEHGLRLVVRATTYGGVEFIAYLMPANEGDPEEGTFVLKTAIPKPAT